MARSGEVIEHPITGERMTFLRTSEETNGECLGIELVVPPGGFVSAMHIHPFQEERFDVVAGSFAFEIDGVARRVGFGETIAVPAGAPHAWRNAGITDAAAIVELRPALRAEEVFESVFGLAQDGEVDPVTGVLNPHWLALIVRDYADVAYPAEPPLATLIEQLAPLAEAADWLGFRLPYPYPHARLRPRVLQPA